MSLTPQVAVWNTAMFTMGTALLGRYVEGFSMVLLPRKVRSMDILWTLGLAENEVALPFVFCWLWIIGSFSCLLDIKMAIFLGKQPSVTYRHNYHI